MLAHRRPTGDRVKNAIRALVATTALAAVPLGAADAQAARITIGSPLTGAYIDGPLRGFPAWSVVTTSSGVGGAVVKSPVEGVVVAWHLEEGSPSYGYALRIFTPAAPGAFTGAGTSAK